MPKKNKANENNNNGSLKKSPKKKNITNNENNNELEEKELVKNVVSNKSNSDKSKKSKKEDMKNIDNDDDNNNLEEFSLDEIDVEDLYDMDLGYEDEDGEVINENEEYLVSEDDLILCPSCGEIIEVERLKRLEECPSCGLPITEFENFEEYSKIYKSSDEEDEW